jgi:hypothetical protein
MRVIGWVLLTTFCLVIASLGVIGITRSGDPQSIPVTAVLNVIEASLNTSTPLDTPTQAIQGQTPLPPPSENIALGAFVQVSGTGGDGLRLREKAGLSSQVKLLASEAEVFRVDGGPIDLDGYTWWYLVGPFDAARTGWAVSNYLVVVQNP